MYTRIKSKGKVYHCFSLGKRISLWIELWQNWEKPRKAPGTNCYAYDAGKIKVIVNT